MGVARGGGCGSRERVVRGAAGQGREGGDGIGGEEGRRVRAAKGREEGDWKEVYCQRRGSVLHGGSILNNFKQFGIFLRISYLI